MKYSEKELRDAPADKMICESAKATKNMVLKAVMAGTKTFEDTVQKVPICGEAKCGCAENVRTLLEIYLPIYDFIFADGGCHHHKKENPHINCDKNTCKDCIHLVNDSCNGDK